MWAKGSSGTFGPFPAQTTTHNGIDGAEHVLWVSLGTRSLCFRKCCSRQQEIRDEVQEVAKFRSDTRDYKPAEHQVRLSGWDEMICMLGIPLELFALEIQTHTHWIDDGYSGYVLRCSRVLVGSCWE